MKAPFHADEREGEKRQRDLDRFGTPFLWIQRPHSPLRRRPRAQGTNSPDRDEIDNRACDRNDFHWNPNGFTVDRVEESCAGDCGGERTDSDQQPQPIERHEGGAGTLEKDEKQTGNADDPGRPPDWITMLVVYGRVLLGQVILQCLTSMVSGVRAVYCSNQRAAAHNSIAVPR